MCISFHIHSYHNLKLCGVKFESSGKCTKLKKKSYYHQTRLSSTILPQATISSLFQKRILYETLRLTRFELFQHCHKLELPSTVTAQSTG